MYICVYILATLLSRYQPLAIKKKIIQQVEQIKLPLSSLLCHIETELANDQPKLHLCIVFGIAKIL